MNKKPDIMTPMREMIEEIAEAVYARKAEVARGAQFYTVRTAAKQLGRSELAVRELMRNGKLRMRKVAGRRQCDDGELERFHREEED